MAFSSALYSFPSMLNVSCSNSEVRATPKSVTNYAISHDFSWISTPSQDHLVLHNKKLKDARQVLGETIRENPFKSFVMIDMLQHLAIDYHFQEEIQSFLTSHYRRLTMASSSNCNASLFEASLSFRLLRQHGYHLTTDVFNKFIDADGKFHNVLTTDLRGMLALYQASQFGIESEDLLDHANAFTSNFLYNSLPNLNKQQVKVIRDALENPCDKTLPRFNVKSYINSYEIKQDSNGIQFQKLAKMDFNIVQSLHQNELLQVSLWWTDLGLAKRMNFARDQPVKWYMWSMAIFPDPMHSKERIELTKPISFVYLMDDIFDVYGKLEELVLFTEAINRWEVDEHLPHPMRIFLKALYDITDEISNDILTKHGWNPMNSFRKAWTGLCNAFLVEARWFDSGNTPTPDEYLKNGIISSGIPLVLVHVFFLLGEGINKESVEVMDNVPSLVSYPAAILRLWDDLGSAKDENQQGCDGSYIECYMKAHKNSTIESAQKHATNMISNIWKELKREYLSPNHFSPSLNKSSVNLARMVSYMYSYDIDQRLPFLEKYINSLLYENFPFAP